MMGVLLWAGCGSATDLSPQPIADAGFDRNDVRLGTAVTLDGSASFDPDGASLDYIWTLEDQPAGSTAVLGAGLEPPHPVLVPDVAGTYLISLVVSNGSRLSRPDIVAVAARNEPPIASAQCDNGKCEVLHGSTVYLVGTLSEDPEGDPLTFSWRSLTAQSPAECAALCPGKGQGNPCDVNPLSLTGSTTQRATAVLPHVKDADFIFEVEVSDGLTTDTDCLVYTTTNQPPFFTPGNTKSTPPNPKEGESFTLSTLPNDPDSADLENLAVTWTQVSPPLPQVTLGAPNSVSTTQTAPAINDPPGLVPTVEFVFQVEVTDGIDTATDQVTVTVTNLP